jgi:hypothetical protein
VQLQVAPGEISPALQELLALLRAYPKNCDLFACGLITLRAARLLG